MILCLFNQGWSYYRYSQHLSIVIKRTYQNFLYFAELTMSELTCLSHDCQVIDNVLYMLTSCTVNIDLLG